jgi:hypothetical protein
MGMIVLRLLVIVALICIVLQPSCLDSFAALNESNAPTRDTIFISIASYRDNECSATIRDIYAKAKYPERIFCGVCEQNSDDVEEACIAVLKGPSSSLCKTFA